MEVAVLYISGTGFTRKYANFIADVLKCDIFELENVSRDDMQKYPLVIYGGWVRGGIIEGLDAARSMARGKLFVFAVGASPSSSTLAASLREKNGLTEIPFFYFEGGLRMERLGYGSKRALEMYKNALKKASYESLDSNQQFFLNNIGRSFDHSSKEETYDLIKKVDLLRKTRPDSSTWFEV
ncbi:MAG: flavodoxin domain-containing protein [Clostridia bacterium]|nr:flavodoxin domain-containing protein [Clostridia bacterium]